LLADKACIRRIISLAVQRHVVGFVAPVGERSRDTGFFGSQRAITRVTDRESQVT
jgi:hypothetical protein